MPRSQGYYLEDPGPSTKHRDAHSLLFPLNIITSVFKEMLCYIVIRVVFVNKIFFSLKVFQPLLNLYYIITEGENKTEKNAS